jgi:tetratricopeptide (TPR) repeat protein
MAEKSLNELPRDLRGLYTRGHDALVRDTFDYAIDLFNQVLLREPGVYEVRKELRTAQQKKAGKSGGFFKKMLSNASSSPMVAKAQMALRKDPAEALHAVEQILNSDPQNNSAHRLAVEAANALDMPRTALMSLEVLNRNLPTDKNVAIQFAHALGALGESLRGERLLAELYRANPLDNDLAQALKDLSARKTLDEGGYEALADGTGSYRDILRNEKEAITLEQENRSVKVEDTAERLIAENETRLKTDPKNYKVLRNLAELWLQKQEFDTALGYYERIRAEGANDPTLDKAIAETRLRKLEHVISQLDPNSNDYAETSARLRVEKQAFQLAEVQKRVERFPTDLQFRFELGQLYFQLGKYSESIQELQKSQANPNRRVASMNLLSQCFAKRKMFDLAARTLQNAIKEKVLFDEEKKDLIYNLGCVFESMGKKEEAVDQFKLIYEVDIGYRDVAAKVDAYYAGQ